jgi:hypothetical protein
MKVGLLLAGIILMAIGALGFLSMSQNLADCGSFVGQVGRTFSSQVNQKCQTANMIQIGGGILFVIGLGLTIGGSVMSSESKHERDMTKSESRKDWLCEHCDFKTKAEVDLIEHYKEQHADKTGDSYHRKYGKKPISSENLEILKRRYAQGEITKEEFDRMKEDLS